MTDITKCATEGCKLAVACYRKTAPNGENQTQVSYEPEDYKGAFRCDNYLYDSRADLPTEAPKAMPGPNLFFSITEGAPLTSMAWSQGACGSRAGQAVLRLGFQDEGSGAFFSLETAADEAPGVPFYFDSADELRWLADLVEDLLPIVTMADVY